MANTSNFTGKYYNLKGMLVGNGATNWHVDAGADALVDTLWGFNMIPTKLYNDYTNNGCHSYFGDVLPATMPGNCNDTLAKVYNIINGVDLYDLYRENNDVALKGKKPTIGEAWVGGEKKTYQRGATYRQYTPWLADIFGENESLDTQMLGDFVSDWLNDNTTRADLNIPESVHAWEMCTDRAGVDAGTYKL